ncbi:STAS domain-containing protein [Planococcus salinus]|uniref:STAS domain-containing protein n=1 Tax=Planococcus salinus TaxID=1848460 RepID=A0A3M8P3Y2_9BACL|nr:STAS domain-containing protein [Planococcus salinus]RNF38375.1 STAS domain-containing protein [Planococcus salinus]
MTSISQLAECPLPALKLDSNLAITDCSKEAEALFGRCASLLDLLDSGSQNKARHFFKPDKSSAALELNFKTLTEELLLADVHSRWESASAVNVIIVPKDNRINEISNQLITLRKRLNDTNFDLLREKERTELLLQQVRELSAPCIKIGRQQLLIPLFGDLDSEKIEAVRSQILNEVYEQDVETAIIDLTAMEQIAADGVTLLESMFQSLRIMGVEGIITGVKPEHAKQLHFLKDAMELRFESSLHSVLTSLNLVK